MVYVLPTSSLDLGHLTLRGSCRVGWVAHKILETAQIPNSPFPLWFLLFGIWDLDFGLTISQNLAPEPRDQMIAAASSRLTINIYSASVRMSDKVPPVYPMWDKYFAASSVSKYDEIAISVSKLQIPEIIASRVELAMISHSMTFRPRPCLQIRHSSTLQASHHGSCSVTNNLCPHLKIKCFVLVSNNNSSQLLLTFTGL